MSKQKSNGNGSIKIEHGVPKPSLTRGKYPLTNMQVGDSFVVDDGATTRNSIYSAARHSKVKVTARKIEDGKMRVWRIA